MASIKTPVCEYGLPAVDFSLKGIDDQIWTLEKCRGSKGILVMFICNHCPYVKAIQQKLVRDTLELKSHGIFSVAIMSNNVVDYPEDSFENMKRVAEELKFPFPYLFDENQKVAKAYGAVCTPDFFGYNSKLELQYRGRFDASGMDARSENSSRDLFEAMLQVSETGQGPRAQVPSIGCSIKWNTL